jgi:hypothetical protein
MKKIETVSPDSLRFHPFLQQLPSPDSELLTSISIDMAERGVDQPLLVDEKNRVLDIDSGDRLKAALQLELAEVPIVRAASADAATIIVQSLLQRRHYTKSALAYITFPFFQSMLEESRQRRIRYLKSEKGADASNSTQNVLFGASAEEVARQAGVSRVLFFQAAEVHKVFKKHPDAKEKFEPKILSGELNLGYAINGVAGMAATKGLAKGQSHQLDLFHRGIHALRTRFSKWNLLPQKCRLLVASEFAEAVAEAPEEVQQSVLAMLKARKGAAK